jgi:hypothetical protein
METLEKQPGDLAALAQLGVFPRFVLRPLLNAGINTIDQMITLTEGEWSLIHMLGPARYGEAKAFLTAHAVRPLSDHKPGQG